MVEVKPHTFLSSIIKVRGQIHWPVALLSRKEFRWTPEAIWTFLEKRNTSLSGIERFLGSTAHCIVTILTELP
jgi:hypothetical protein